MPDVGRDEGGEGSLHGLGYSANGQLHVIPSDTSVWIDENLVERESALCGGSFENASHYHDVNGHLLTDELRKGMLCRACLAELKAEGITIPGFMKEGEVVARV